MCIFRLFVSNIFIHFIFFLEINGKEIQSYVGNHSPVDTDPISRLSQIDSGLITKSCYGSRSRHHSPTNSIYRHSAASSIDSGRSSTLLYENSKVSEEKQNQ